MNRFIFSKLQLSPLSIACLGYLLFSILEKLSLFKSFIGLALGTLLIIIILSFLKRHRKGILIGYACLILIHMSIRWNFSLSILKEEHLNSILENSTELLFHLEKKIGKNFYRGSLLSKEGDYSILIQTDEYVRNVLRVCEKNSITRISLSNLEKNKETEDYSFYLRIENCKQKKDLSFRKRFREFVFELLKKGGLLNSSTNIGMGLIFGDTSYLDDTFKTASKEGGIIHLFAASGLHLGIFLGSLSLLCVKIFRFNFYLEKIVPIFIGFGYLYVLNFPVSLSRAYLFALMWMLSKLFFRSISPLNLLILCSTIISLVQFGSFLEVGFLLSFGAVLGIFYLKKPFDDLLFGKHSNYFTDLITVSLGAGLGTFPILVFFFHSYSFGSIFLNLFLIPICTILLPSLYISLSLEFINFPIIKELFWTLTDLLLRTAARITLDVPDSLRFYRTYVDSENHILLFYFLFIILVLILYFIKTHNFSEDTEQKIELEIISSNLKELILLSKVKFLRLAPHLLFSLLCLFFILSFNYISYIYNYPEKIIKIQEPIIRFSSFLIQENKNLYINGSCFFYDKKIKESLSKNYCESSYSIHINDSSCIKYFIHCKEKPNIYLYNKENRDRSEIFYAFPEIQKMDSEIPRSFGTARIHFFAPHKESLERLKLIAQKEPGIIYLQFPYKSKDSSEDWNRYKKYLGIDEKWEFKTIQIHLELK